FNEKGRVIGVNSQDFDAKDLLSVTALVQRYNPILVINCVALLGLTPCEENPQNAIQLNTRYPQQLARLAKQHRFLLIHLSSDAVFNNSKKPFTESSPINPLNFYGWSKAGGDHFITLENPAHYILRTPLIFGPSQKNNQLVEKLIIKMKTSQEALYISEDVWCSPSYSLDIAKRALKLLEQKAATGIYHLYNQGYVSLFELVQTLAEIIQCPTIIHRASQKDFPSLSLKNQYTQLTSEKISPLRPWQEALQTFCQDFPF
ncbi:SDR family oxidoreductase, partial [Magnetococcales bacterium HHB-1]